MKITNLSAMISAIWLTGCSVAPVARVDNTYQGVDAMPAPNAKRVVESSTQQAIDSSIGLSEGTAIIEGITSLNLNDKGDVKILQQALVNHGYDPGPVDGKFGPKTKRALATFRAANNLQSADTIGRDELKVLFSG